MTYYDTLTAHLERQKNISNFTQVATATLDDLKAVALPVGANFNVSDSDDSDVSDDDGWEQEECVSSFRLAMIPPSRKKRKGPSSSVPSAVGHSAAALGSSAAAIGSSLISSSPQEAPSVHPMHGATVAILADA